MVEMEKTPSVWQRWGSIIFLAVLLIPITILQPYRNGPAIRSDGDGYHLWTYAFLKGDLGFTWCKEEGGTVGLIQPKRKQHRFFCKYAPGLALIRLPVMALVVDASRDGLPYSAGEHWSCLILSALAFLGVAALCLRICLRLGASYAASHATVLLLTLGTGLFHYATYDCSFSHIYSALGSALLLWLAVVAVQDRDGHLSSVLALIVLALFILVRNTNVVIVGFWSLWFLAWGWLNGVRSWKTWLKNGFVVVLGVSLGAGVQLALNYQAFGRLQLSSYGDESFDWSRLMLREVLFSFERGLFTYYPVLGIAMIAGLITPATRLATALFGGLVLAYGVLYGFWSTWFLGCGFGHRGFVELVPLACPLLAVSLSRVGCRTNFRIRVAGTVATCMTIVLMIGYWRGTYPMLNATGRDYASHLTLSLYKRFEKVLSVARPAPRFVDDAGRGLSEAAVGVSSGDVARNTARAPGE